MMNKEVVETTLRQLGGNKFIVMVGAKHISGIENTLAFWFMRNSSKSTHCQITLNGSDLYDIKFGRVRKATYIVDKEYHDVFNDQLVEIFENYTGLRTKLF